MKTSPAPRPLTRVVLGLTGGIAAYKAAELTRLLVKEGITVDVVMTPGATQFITPMTLQALSGRRVLTDLWDSGAANAMGHIDLSRGPTPLSWHRHQRTSSPSWRTVTPTIYCRRCAWRAIARYSSRRR